MRAKSIVLLLIAGVCGLVASIGISQVIDRRSNTADTPMGEVFVAVADIDIGAKLDSKNVKLDKWPKDRIPEGAINNLEDLKDRYPRVRLYAGEPILKAKLMDSKGGKENSAKIPEGFRVVSVKVTMDEVVSGLVQPGDRVDVVLFVREGKEIPRTMSQTILREVRVFAINAETERSVDAESEQAVAKTVSLLVKPNQVETIMLAAELGKLRLSLRRPNDPNANVSDEGTDIETLLTGGDKQGDEKPPVAVQPQPAGGGLLDLLNKTQTPTGTEAVALPGKSGWKMTILSGTGSTQFEWQDSKELPQQVGVAGADSPADSGPSPSILNGPVAPEPVTPPAPRPEPDNNDAGE